MLRTKGGWRGGRLTCRLGPGEAVDKGQLLEGLGSPPHLPAYESSPYPEARLCTVVRALDQTVMDVQRQRVHMAGAWGHQEEV